MPGLDWGGPQRKELLDSELQEATGKVLIKHTNKSQVLTVLGNASGAAVALRTRRGAQLSKDFAPKPTSMTSVADIPSSGGKSWNQQPLT